MERSESDHDSPWGSSPLTDSASPQLDPSEGLDMSCVYRQFTDTRSLCHSLYEEQLHTAAPGHTHAQGQSCEHGRCEAGRYFLGGPPSGRETWWDGTRSLVPPSKSSMENHEGCERNMPHITAVHNYHGEVFHKSLMYDLRILTFLFGSFPICTHITHIPFLLKF